MRFVLEQTHLHRLLQHRVAAFPFATWHLRTPPEKTCYVEGVEAEANIRSLYTVTNLKRFFPCVDVCGPAQRLVGNLSSIGEGQQASSARA